MPLTPAQRAHWQVNRRWSIALLIAWVCTTLGVPWFVDELNRFDFIGPLGFYMAAQGALLIFLLIIVAYARAMAANDARFGMSEEEP